MASETVMAGSEMVSSPSRRIASMRKKMKLQMIEATDTWRHASLPLAQLFQ